MDPNANLDEQILLAARLQQLGEVQGRRSLTEAEEVELWDSSQRLAELVEALDHWLTGGGFLPQRWTDARGRINCSRCGKSVSTVVPTETIVRAWVECPECMEKRGE